MEEEVLTTDKVAKTAQRWRFISQLAAKKLDLHKINFRRYHDNESGNEH